MIYGNHILVGLGGTGGKILRAFKMRIFEEFHTQELRSKLPVSLLYVDSTDEMMPKDGRARPDFRVMGQDASFTKNEFFNIKGVDVEHILDHIRNYPSVNGIVNNVSAVKSAIGSLGEAAGQKRRAGRLLFAANAVGYVNSLRNAYARCEACSGDASSLCIYIFAGLCGGTGSGSIVDVILQTRKAFPNAIISVFAMIPEMNLPKPNMDQGRYYQNGYAALNELNALQSGRWYPQDVTGMGELKLFNDRVKGVANGLTLYSNVNENGLTVNSLTELPKIVSDFVYARIFQMNATDEAYGDIIRAYSFENMDDFALEFDEVGHPDAMGRMPVARTKKLNSFGIKRVMYPELRILKHITYRVGVSVLYQFKYNNWRENQGYVNEEKNKDYRAEYLNKDNLTHWLLDEGHLTLNTKILPSDEDYLPFSQYWHDKAIGYAEQAKSADCPLNELDNIMGEFFGKHFRNEGVEAFFQGKERAIPEMSREIRSLIEHELFEKWKLGDISVVELQKVSKLLLEEIAAIREGLEQRFNEERVNFTACDEDRAANVEDWQRLGILQRMVGKGARLYAEHQNILTDYYTSRTYLVAWDFAKKLAAKLFVDLGRMDADIATFAQKVNDAIDETERLLVAQRKVNKGLEDMKGAIIEVSEDEAIVTVEEEIVIDKVDMPNISRQIREDILPKSDFTNFANLSNDVSVDTIKDAFDITLSEIVRQKHAEKTDGEKKVLGLNILTQLQQKLRTDDDINAFASKVVSQSGVFLDLNNDQLQLHLRNNEGNLSPTNPASINKKVIFVSIPSPDDNENLKRFADKLETAFLNSINQGVAQTSITVHRKSPRKNELSIVTVGYCFPMRAIGCLATYRERYERFLHTGNPNTDMANAILLHTEGDGSNLPALFAVDNAEEVAGLNAPQPMGMAQPQQPMGMAQPQQPMGMAQPQQPVGMPPMPPTGMPPMPPVPPMPVEPEIALRMTVAGQVYGPFNREQCKQMVTTGQLTQQSLVWMEGMPAWAPAGTVATLQTLFAPPAAPGMPPLPPMGGGVPPVPPMGGGVPPVM